MQFQSMLKRFGKWLVIASLAGSALAFAQTEPTLNQVYSAAQAGKLDEAQVMMQQVLVAHPKSAKAFFVQAELFARQGKLDRAREALATAEQFAPGLPFAKPQAVTELRQQLAAKAPQHVVPVPAPATTYGASAAASHADTGSSWALPLLLAGGVIVAGYFMFRRKTPDAGLPPAPYGTSYGAPNGLSGPQTFGSGPGAMQPAGYPPQGYAQPTGSGLGGRIMGGVATGLAVGAGVMAAEAIGRNLMGNHNGSAGTQDNTHAGYAPVADTNADMGGANFGVNDTSSWDDAGSADMGGGGDWDN